MFESLIKPIDLDKTPGFQIIDPSAGMLTLIIDRSKLFESEDGKIKSEYWYSLFVLSCLKKDNNFVICSLTDAGFNTAYDLYSQLENEVFIAVIKSFIREVPKSALDYWYEEVDKFFLVSKKMKDEAKND